MGGVTGRAGGDWEWAVTRYGQAAGLPWDKAPLRGDRDLLDITGTLPSGYLVGCKGITRKGGKSFGDKISEAMDQCDSALIHLADTPRVGGWGITWREDGHGHRLIDCAGIVPVQIMKRSGYPIGKAYVVTQFDYWLQEVIERTKGRAEQ